MEQEMKRGDSPTTAITNAMAGDGGYPAETESGELVSIVRKENTVNGTNKLYAADGRVFREARRGEVPGLKPYDGEEDKDEKPVVEDDGQPPFEPTSTVSAADE